MRSTVRATLRAAVLLIVVSLAAASGVRAQPTELSEVERRCEELAAPRPDRGLERIDVDRALEACAGAVVYSTNRPRYQFLNGRALLAAKNYRIAAAFIEAASNAGDRTATYYFGFLHEAGVGVQKDLAEAARLYQRAGDAGEPDAYARLGALLITGARTEPSTAARDATYRRAVQLLQASADRGATSGLPNLGWLYERGLGVPQDKNTAVRLYDKASKAGEPMGAYRLGLMYLDGVAAWPKDLRSACNQFRAAAERGIPHAQAELGACYALGRTGTPDMRAAFEWFSRAAEAGLARAQEIVGEMYDRGDGVVASPERAVEWYRKAVAQDDPYAMFQLASHLRSGRGVAWNEAEAMQWYAKGAALGDTSSMLGLAFGYLDGLGGSRQDYPLSARWFAEAAKYRPATSDQELTLGFARINLAQLYEKGWGVPQDTGQARQLFALASESPQEFVASEGRRHLARMATTAERAGPPQESVWSTLVPILVVGGLAALAVEGLSHSGPSDPDSAQPYYFDWVETKLEEDNLRMQAGCFWDEWSYINYGHC